MANKIESRETVLAEFTRAEREAAKAYTDAALIGAYEDGQSDYASGAGRNRPEDKALAAAYCYGYESMY